MCVLLARMLAGRMGLGPQGPLTLRTSATPWFVPSVGVQTFISLSLSLPLHPEGLAAPENA